MAEVDAETRLPTTVRASASVGKRPTQAWLRGRKATEKRRKTHLETRLWEVGVTVASVKKYFPEQRPRSFGVSKAF